MPLYADFLTGLRLALRAKYLWLIVCSLLVLALTAILSAEFSPRQPATVALDVGLSTIRLLLPFVLAMVVQEALAREFDRRYFLTSVTYPRPRYDLLLGRFFAVSALILGLLLLLALVLAVLVWRVGQGYDQATPVALDYHYLITVSFIAVDLLVLIALACYLAVAASTPSFVLVGTLGFMLVTRSFGAIVDLLSRNTFVVADADSYRAGLGALGYLLPDLGALDVRMITLYGKMEFLPADWGWLLLSNLAYVAGLLALAAWTLQRKRFA